MPRLLAPALLLGAALVCALPSVAQPPVTGELLVNSPTSISLVRPAVGIDPEGNFIVTWESGGSSNSEIVARRFDRAGSPLAPEWQVNTTTSRNQNDPSVAVDPLGNFIVVWAHQYDLSGWRDLLAQPFLFTGTFDGPEIEVNVMSDDSHLRVAWGNSHAPDVAVDDAGSSVVVWVTDQSPGDDPDTAVVARRLAADGTPLGDAFQVNTYTTGSQGHPRVAMDALGNFVVVWASNGSPGSDHHLESVQARRWDRLAGDWAGPQFQVNETAVSRNQASPDIALNSSGEFVVAFKSGYSFPAEIWMRRFGADGTASGPDHRVDTNIGVFLTQADPAVGIDSSGDVIVAWRAATSLFGDDESGSSIQARGVLADGSLLDQFQVNSYTTGEQTEAQVAMTPDGRFVVAWQSQVTTPLQNPTIRARTFRPPSWIFGDGFESGDTAGWSP